MPTRICLLNSLSKSWSRFLFVCLLPGSVWETISFYCFCRFCVFLLCLRQFVGVLFSLCRGGYHVPFLFHEINLKIREHYCWEDKTMVNHHDIKQYKNFMAIDTSIILLTLHYLTIMTAVMAKFIAKIFSVIMIPATTTTNDNMISTTQRYQQQQK